MTPALKGLGWQISSGVLFIGVTAGVKLVGDDLPAAQAAFLRYALGLVFLVPMLRPMAQAHLTRAQWGLFGLRGLAHALAVIAWFYAMVRIPIAEVTAMNYLTPVYVSLGAMLLWEGLRPRRLAAIAVALLGALIILRPGVREVDPGHLAMLFTAVSFACGYLLAKRLSGQVSATVVVGMLNVVVTAVLAPFAWAVWVPPSATDLALLFGVACLATAGHYAMTFAFQSAPLTVTQPATFLQLIWATALGALAFGEAVDGYVILGGAVIVAAVVYTARREALARRIT
ncbi:MAG: DMT family transporter [Paracoccaceae bacterium]